MTVDEAARHRLFNKLEEVLGREEAGTLMTSLPTYEFEDVATKRDIDVLRAEMQSVKHEVIGSLRQEMNSLITTQTRTIMITLLGVAFSITSLAFFR